MKSTPFISSFIFFVLITAAGNTARAEGIDTLEKFRNVYFAAIGNNDLTSVGFPYKFNYSEADTRHLLNFLAKDSFFIKGKQPHSFFPSILTGNNASLSNLNIVLDTIARKATKDDAFIFYYNGIAGKIKGNNVAMDNLPDFNFKTGNAIDLNEYNAMILKGDTPGSQLTTGWLKNKLDLIPCGHILLIIDANNADRIAYELMNDIADKNSLLYNLKGKKIRLIFPEGGLIYENSPIQSGDFVYTLVRTPKVTLENYFYDVTPVLSGKLSQTRQEKFFNTEFVYVTDFDQFLSIKAAVLKDAASCEPNTRSELDEDDEAPAYTKKEVVNYALLIGTDVYEAEGWRTLNNPVFDATTLAGVLKNKFGFETRLLTNPRGDEILQSIEDIRNNIRFDSVYSQLLVFVAGHGGWEESAPGFIVPKDALPKDKDKFRRTYISLASIRSILSNIKCPHILVMIDACYGGTFDEMISASSGARDEETKNKMDRQFIERTLKPK